MLGEGGKVSRGRRDYKRLEETFEDRRYLDLLDGDDVSQVKTY